MCQRGVATKFLCSPPPPPPFNLLLDPDGDIVEVSVAIEKRKKTMAHLIDCFMLQVNDSVVPTPEKTRLRETKLKQIHSPNTLLPNLRNPAKERSLLAVLNSSGLLLA